MAYTQKTWEKNELIEASDLNKIEQGIKDNETNINTVEDRVTDVENDISKIYLGYKIYSSWSDIGLSFSNATSLLTITQAMGGYSVLFLNINSGDGSAETLYNYGVIPVNYPGTLEIWYASRARAIFTRDTGAIYVTATGNANTTDFASWKAITTTTV